MWAEPVAPRSSIVMSYRITPMSINRLTLKQGEVGLDLSVHADGSVTSKVQPLGSGLVEEAERSE